MFDFNSSGFPPNLLKSVQFHSSVLSGSPNFSSFSSAAISTSSHPHLIPQHQDGTSNPCSPSTLPHNPNHHRRLNNIYHDPPPLLAHQHRSYGNDDNSAYAFLRRTIECSCGRRYNRERPWLRLTLRMVVLLRRLLLLLRAPILRSETSPEHSAMVGLGILPFWLRRIVYNRLIAFVVERLEIEIEVKS